MADKELDLGREPQTPTQNAGPSSPTTTEVASDSSVHEFNEQTNYVPRRTIITIFLACAGADLLALMDQTTLAASLYIVGESLGAMSQVSWIASGYFITSTVGQLVYGRLSDIWSRKVVLLTGLAIFFFGSLASSLSQSVLQLTIFRAFTGIGGGGLMTVAQLIVSDVVPLRERGKYQGILVKLTLFPKTLPPPIRIYIGLQGAVVAIANGIGPVIGGALSSSSEQGWRWIFRLNMPLTILTTAGVIFFMPLKKVNGDWKMKLKAVDFFGIFLALGGTIVLILGLTWGGGQYSWDSAHVIASLVVGFALCVGFVFWQWKGPRYPLVPLHVFKSKIVNGACITMAINGWNFVVQVYYVPSFYQLVYGYSATKAGAMLLPITLIQTASSTLSGLIVHWVGRYRECILFGWACWAVGLGLMSTLDDTTGVAKQIGYSILIGVGVGNTLQPSLIAVQAGASRRDMAVVTSFRNFVRNLGSTLGLAISGSIINNVVSDALSSDGISGTELDVLLGSPQRYLATLPSARAQQIRDDLTPAYKESFRIIFLVGAGLCSAAFVFSFFMMPQVELSRPDDEKLKEEGRKAQLEKKREKSEV
ncbi:to MFS drug transporter [Geosmithia morbida]|uniref:To MFS drug transporter n=1 Tax=Geosmithia morbida TaxID=1094350 RepID=A0A9P4Z301_9HYPO|nr:to MFS drug transporter [Geosmithia morbida]KAF4126489.1 to MFS drug transporter [Geosmithia morbida]